MARKPRIHFPGAVYHVILRGNAGQQVFFSKADRSRFYLLLQEGIERFEHRIHAFCLMTNHLHLAIQVFEIPLSRIMQNVGFRYTRYINRRKKQTGHLFQGRYKALLIDADSYLLELIRYIHLNPVRAGIAKTPEEYTWSSHRAYAGEEQISWLTTDWALHQFSRQRKNACRLYGEYVKQGLTEGHRDEFHKGKVEGRILGDDSFAEKSLQQAEQKYQRRMSIKEIMMKVCNHYDIKLDDLAAPGKNRRLAEARSMASLLVLESEDLTLAGLGRLLKRDLSGLSQAAGRLQKRMLRDTNLAKKIEKIKSI